MEKEFTLHRSPSLQIYTGHRNRKLTACRLSTSHKIQSIPIYDGNLVPIGFRYVTHSPSSLMYMGEKILRPKKKDPLTIFTIDGITVKALNRRNAERKVENIKAKK